MVFIDGVKYACATCIKGHRSTTCQHSDRELFAIKKKGRPITQCPRCRELRKTQKLHVKCNCMKREELILPTATQEIQADGYQPVSGDRTSVGALLNPCQCLTGAKCICCRPDSSDTQHFDLNSDKEFSTLDTVNFPSISNDPSYLSSSVSSSQTTIYTLPPISDLNHHQHYDNTKDERVDSQLRFISPLSNNGGVYSEHINSSVAQRNSSLFTNIVPLERFSYNDKDDYTDKSLDQSAILGKEICHSTSADLANIIYSPFQSCSPDKAGCCGGNKSIKAMLVCRCGSGCKCSGCDAHAKRVNVGNSHNSTGLSSNCCSSYHEYTQPEHKKVRDEDGVLLCGCGCQKLDTDCADCLKSLCEEYLLK